MLSQLRIGLQSFYRESELLLLRQKPYSLRTTVEQALERLPFPDP